ncbi:hypothetical protein BJ912DRAFT_1064872 [Pholiota molesta]|nr:hypothetical protein BJ912DRAFT_1064872 [Pholiota molesta]
MSAMVQRRCHGAPPPVRLYQSPTVHERYHPPSTTLSLPPPCTLRQHALIARPDAWPSTTTRNRRGPAKPHGRFDDDRFTGHSVRLAAGGRYLPGTALPPITLPFRRRSRRPNPSTARSTMRRDITAAADIDDKRRADDIYYLTAAACAGDRVRPRDDPRRAFDLQIARIVVNGRAQLSDSYATWAIYAHRSRVSNGTRHSRRGLGRQRLDARGGRGRAQQRAAAGKHRLEHETTTLDTGWTATTWLGRSGSSREDEGAESTGARLPLKSIPPADFQSMPSRRISSSDGTQQRADTDMQVSNARIAFEDETGNLLGAERREGKRPARVQLRASSTRAVHTSWRSLREGASSKPMNDDANGSVSDHSLVCCTYQRDDDNERDDWWDGCEDGVRAASGYGIVAA